MRYWFDTEFIEDGRTIAPLSLGIVSEDGRQFYTEFMTDLNKHKPNDFVKEHVLPRLTGATARATLPTIRAKLEFYFRSAHDFNEHRPELWAYYADYDWVMFCQIYGTMMDLPPWMPRYCRDVKQYENLVGGVPHPPNDNEHHALSDAWWACGLWHRIFAMAMVRKKDELFFT